AGPRRPPAPAGAARAAVPARPRGHLPATARRRKAPQPAAARAHAAGAAAGSGTGVKLRTRFFPLGETVGVPAKPLKLPAVTVNAAPGRIVPPLVTVTEPSTVPVPVRVPLATVNVFSGLTSSVAPELTVTLPAVGSAPTSPTLSVPASMTVPCMYELAGLVSA